MFSSKGQIPHPREGLIRQIPQSLAMGTENIQMSGAADEEIELYSHDCFNFITAIKIVYLSSKKNL